MMLDTEFNITYLTLDGYTELQSCKYLYFVIVFTAYVLVLCSNSAIVVVIVTHRDLHEPMYVFIAALLLNSVLLSTNIYPKLLMDFLSEQQLISYQACLFQFFLFYTLNGSEFLLLAAMAYDRYVSICRPLQYPSIMTKTRVSVLLLLVWTVPASHVIITITLFTKTNLCNFTLKAIFCNNAIYGLQCVQSRAIIIYGVVPLLDLVMLPVIFILFTYTKILIIAYGSGRDVRRKAAETCLPHLLVLTSFFCLSIYDISIARVEARLPAAARFVMTLQIVLYHPLFNPVIYGLKMKEISRQLRKLFCADPDT